MSVNEDLHIRCASESDLVRFADEPSRHGMLRERLHRQEKERGELWMALHRGTPIGYVYLWFEEADEPIVRKHLHDVPLIMNLWVDEDYRGQGLGRQLMSTAEDRLRDLGHQQVALGVGPENTIAIRLYERLDYHPWKRSPQIATMRVEFGLDGAVLHEMREFCAVYVKDLCPVTALLPTR